MQNHTGTTEAKTGNSNLTVDYDAQTLTLTFAGMLTAANKKKIGSVTIPFEAIERFEPDGKDCVRIILKHHRSDWSTQSAENALYHPMALHVRGGTARRDVDDIAASIKTARHKHSRKFTPPAIGRKINKPAHRFGDVKLEGNNIVHNGARYPIAGASATIGTGVSGGAGLSLKRAAVGGALIGGTGAILGGLSGDSGKLMLEVTLDDGRTIVASGKSKESDAAVAIVNEVSEWSPRLASAGNAPAEQ